MPQIKTNEGYVEAKWYIKSWTVWFNAIALLIPILDVILKYNLIHDKDVYAFVLAVFNLLLRFKTKFPITIKKD